jgi:hypothetical protein
MSAFSVVADTDRMGENREEHSELQEFAPMAANASGNSDQNSVRFFELFSQHWQAGTGLPTHDKRAMDRDGRWIVRTFSNAMEWAGIPSTDPATIQSWLRGQRWPQRERKDAILKVFFRVPKGQEIDSTARLQREELDQAWLDGQSRARHEPQMAEQHSEPEAPKRWMPAGTSAAIAGLASVRVAEPAPANDPASGWFVKARIRLGQAEYEREDGTPVYIAVEAAVLSVAASGYQVATGSLIGHQSDHSNFRQETDNDSVAVIGPAPRNCLEGDPAHDETLARIVPIAESGSDESVGVSLHAFRRCFVVSLTPTPLDCVGFEEKQAVLNRFIELGRERDAQGRVLLARDKMIRVNSE